MNYSKELELAIDTAQEAGRIVRKYYNEMLNITEKDEGRKGIVTKADKESEKVIVRALKKTKFSILGEETGSLIQNKDSLWIVDPLDGTANYLHGLPFFSISIGLIKNNRMQLGVVYSPISDELFYAEKGGGAFLNGRRIHVSDNTLMSNISVFCTHYYTKRSKELFLEAMKRLTPLFWRRILGSSALELSYVACGKGEAFLSSEEDVWNCGAGILIAEEAGGIATNWKGEKWDHTQTSILVSSKELHPYFVKLLADIK